MSLIIGLGGNVGDEAAIVARFDHARAALAQLAVGGGLRSAPLYRTAPVGPDQPDFLNTAVCLVVDGRGTSTGRATEARRGASDDAQPAEVIAAVREIERLLGRDREREARWGPRRIDLDVLVWGARIVRTPELEVPHPRLAERRFALDPLVALLGEDFVVPGAGVAGELLRRAGAQRCEQVAATW